MSLVRKLVVSVVTASVVLVSVPSVYAAAPPVKTDVSSQQARVTAFQDIVGLAKAPTVDWAALRAAYRTKLQETVKARDTEYKETINESIEAFINAGEAGQISQAVVTQLIDKTLQKVFTLNVKHEFTKAKEKAEAGDTAGALHHIDEAIAYFEAVRGTVQKRDKAFGTTLEDQIDSALSQAQAAAETGDLKMLYFLQPAVTHNLVLTFYMGISGYADKIEAGAAAGKDESVHMAEGWAFFQSIRGNVGKKTPDLRDFVETRLNPVSGNPALVKGEEIKNAMTAGLFGYVQNYTVEYEKNWDNNKRFHALAEGAVIAQGLEKQAGAALGAEAQSKFAAAVQGWVKATLADDRAAAAAEAKVVQEIAQAAQLKLAAAPADSIQLQIGSGTVKSFGKWLAIDAAAKIEDGRTLVPVRFVSEALGAEVKWHDAFGVASVVANGQVILLQPGNKQVSVNGKSIELDVPAKSENGRLLVPARFIVENLNAKVDWNEATRTFTITK